MMGTAASPHVIIREVTYEASPTTDMMWSIARVADRYVQRGEFGERELSHDDVERIVRGRHYHSTRVGG